MKTLHSGLVAVALATGFAAPGTFHASQADAAPVFLPKTATAQSDVVQVGHRYRNWYPAGAFVAGALIGGAIANNNRYYGGYYGGYYAPNYYNSIYRSGYYRRAYYPDYYGRRVYYSPRGTAYSQGYRDGFRDGVNARYYGDITCTARLQDAGKC
jgi:hypothetical protein